MIYIAEEIVHDYNSILKGSVLLGDIAFREMSKHLTYIHVFYIDTKQTLCNSSIIHWTCLG